jgi:hypothetical protein
MLVFWDQRLACLATPKTGSTAIATALESLASLSVQRPPVLKHTTLMRFQRFLGPYLEVSSGQPFEVVALMREPRDWLGSWYRYRQRDDIAEASRHTRGRSFDEFVRAWCEESPPDYAAVGSQAQFLKPRHDKAVDRLFRYEEIDRFVGYLEDRLGCELTLPRLNVSPPGAVELEPLTETLLRKVAAADFRLYETVKGAD